MSDKRIYERFRESVKPRECPVCKKIFTPASGNQVYCSAECKNEMRSIVRQRVGNAVKVTPSSELSDNMKKIAEMVKDDPRYGLKVAKEEGRIK